MPRSSLTVQYPTEVLYMQYVDKTIPQPCYVWIDPQGRKMGAGVSSTDARSPEVANGLERNYTVDAILTVKGWRKLLSALKPLARRVIAGWSSVWNGSRWVGRLTEDAEQAEEEIACVIERMSNSSEYTIKAWPADQWLYGGEHKLGITATTTDETLEALAAKIEREAERRRVIVVDCLQFLRELRETARQKEEG